MPRVVLKDSNGQLCPFETNDLLEEMIKLMPGLTGVSMDTIAVVKSALSQVGVNPLDHAAVIRWFDCLPDLTEDPNDDPE